MYYKCALSLFFLVFAMNAYAQKDTLPIALIYEDASKNLVASKTVMVEGVSAGELLKRIETWGGGYFRNYEEVRIAKTESGVALLYITSAFGLLDMYQKMNIVCLGDEALIQVYDDGNVYKPASGSGQVQSPAIGERKYKVKSYFNDGANNDAIVYKTAPGSLNMKEKHASGAVAYRNDTDAIIRSIENALMTATVMTSDEALAELKKAKDKLDLQLITQEEYDKIKTELAPYIK